jgi:dTDP-4-amino-4,6-dideoxygalactose transaminase
VTVFSFYANKTLCTGEGGMLVTRRPEIAARARTMRLHGISRDAFDRFRSTTPAWQYEVVAPGFKYNMPDLAAAIGLVQLEKVEAMRQARERIAQRYNEAFRNLPLSTPHQAHAEDRHAWHLYVIRLDLDRLDLNRDRFIEQMSAVGIGTSVHYIPLHFQPYWRDRYGLKPEDFPQATAAYREVVSLPIYPGLTDAELERVIATVRDLCVRYGR